MTVENTTATADIKHHINAFNTFLQHQRRVITHLDAFFQRQRLFFATGSSHHAVKIAVQHQLQLVNIGLGLGHGKLGVRVLRTLLAIVNTHTLGGHLQERVDRAFQRADGAAGYCTHKDLAKWQLEQRRRIDCIARA